MTIERFREAITRYLLPILVPVLAVFFYFYDPAKQQRFFLTCVFHQCTGLHCPGCGGQRAVHQLLHGNLNQAADYNLMLVLAVPLLLANAVVHLLNLFLNQKIIIRLWHSPLFARIVLIFVVAFFVLRNLPFHSFQWLAP